MTPLRLRPAQARAELTEEEQAYADFITDDGREQLTLNEAAEALGVTPDTLRQQIAAGSLKATKRYRQWFVTAKEVEKYRKEHRRG